MKIIVIGAGISGLVFAHACQRAGMEVKIYDSAEELRTIGGGVLLWPHAIRFLKELQLAEYLQEAWQSARAVDIISHTGQNIFHEQHDDLYHMLDGEILPIDRSLMQQILVDKLPAGTLQLNKSCTGVAEIGGKVVANFQDGTTESADLVVGADGIHSAVREELFPAAQPTYSGFCWWGGIVDGSYVPELPKDHVHFVMGLRKLASIWPTHGGKFMWYLPVKMPLEQFQLEGDGRAQAQGLVTGWNDVAVKLVAAPQFAERFHVPINEMPPLKTYSKGRAVLIGDAACTFGPLLGQGANKAIEDAFVLSRLLQTSGSLADKLSRYDELRQLRHAKLFELEHAAADSLMQDSEEQLAGFEAALPSINLAFMYQDVIPLVNQAACDALIAACSVLAEAA